MPEGLIYQAVNPQQPRQERDPLDLQDVVTQQTEILAGMIVELQARSTTSRSCGATGGPSLRLVQVSNRQVPRFPRFYGSCLNLTSFKKACGLVLAKLYK